jgi:hypothetical protein
MPSHETERFELEVASITFVNYPDDSRGKVSNSVLRFKTFGDVEVEFQLSSDTATHRGLLSYFRNKYAKRMESIYDAAPTRTRLP